MVICSIRYLQHGTIQSARHAVSWIGIGYQLVAREGGKHGGRHGGQSSGMIYEEEESPGIRQIYLRLPSVVTGHAALCTASRTRGSEC